jgi:hypothetical protein
LAVTFCLCVHETTKSIEFLQTWYHDVLLWLLCFLMINILVILLTIEIYWLLLVVLNINGVIFGCVMLMTTVQSINMKLEPMNSMCWFSFQRIFAE